MQLREVTLPLIKDSNRQIRFALVGLLVPTSDALPADFYQLVNGVKMRQCQPARCVLFCKIPCCSGGKNFRYFLVVENNIINCQKKCYSFIRFAGVIFEN